MLRAGRVAQAGTPRELYRAPADLELARFLGAAVVLPGDVPVATRSVHTVLGELALDRPGTPGPAQVLLRPEQLRIAGTGRAGVLRTVAFGGPDTVLTVAVDGGPVVTVRERSRERSPGDRVCLLVDGPVRAWPA